MENDRILTIKEAAEYTGYSPKTIRNHTSDWRFFKMPNSRIWKVRKSDLDLIMKGENNTDRLALSVEEVKLCRSTKEKTVKHGGLISQPQTVRELDALLKRL